MGNGNPYGHLSSSMLGNRRVVALLFFFTGVIDKWLDRSERRWQSHRFASQDDFNGVGILVASLLVSRRGNLSQRVLLPRTFLPWAYAPFAFTSMARDEILTRHSRHDVCFPSAPGKQSSQLVVSAISRRTTRRDEEMAGSLSWRDNPARVERHTMYTGCRPSPPLCFLYTVSRREFSRPRQRDSVGTLSAAGQCQGPSPTIIGLFTRKLAGHSA